MHTQEEPQQPQEGKKHKGVGTTSGGNTEENRPEDPSGKTKSGGLGSTLPFEASGLVLERTAQEHAPPFEIAFIHIKKHESPLFAHYLGKTLAAVLPFKSTDLPTLQKNAHVTNLRVNLAELVVLYGLDHNGQLNPATGLVNIHVAPATYPERKRLFMAEAGLAPLANPLPPIKAHGSKKVYRHLIHDFRKVYTLKKAVEDHQENSLAAPLNNVPNAANSRIIQGQNVYLVVTRQPSPRLKPFNNIYSFAIVDCSNQIPPVPQLAQKIDISIDTNTVPLAVHNGPEAHTQPVALFYTAASATLRVVNGNEPDVEEPNYVSSDSEETTD